MVDDEENEGSMAALRELLADGTDEQLASFLTSYSLAEGAARLISQMSPLARQGFFASLVAQYPKDFGFRGGKAS